MGQVTSKVRVKAAALGWVGLLVCVANTASAQTDAGAITLTGRMTQLLQQTESGHSPSAAEIAAAMDQVVPVKADLRTAVPLIVRALGSTDKDVRTYTLTVLQGLESSSAQGKADASEPAAASPAPAAGPGTLSAPQALAAVAGPSTFSPEIARELGPAIPKIAAELTEENQTNRVLAAAVLGGFGPVPPAGVSAALLAFLKRDDAVGPVGQAVVEDLLDFGSVSRETPQSTSSLAQLSQTKSHALPGAEDAMIRYIHRPDQTGEARGDLIDAIAQRGDRSPAVNAALLDYFNAEDDGVRARLILSLPQLLLTQDLFADTRSRVAALADNTGEPLRVVTAAKSVAVCWTQVRMTAGCPVY